MSGYLEVKYPSKSNLGLNPFKSWKRQWCILRPSPTCSGGALAVYCSEAGGAAGTVDLPFGCVVRRAKSRTRPYAFAVFPVDDPPRPRILLAATSLLDAQAWMEKIRSLLNGDKLLGTETLLKDSYSVTVVTTDLSRKCGLSGDSVLRVSSNGLLVSRAQKLGTFIEWKHISDVVLTSDANEKNKICVLSVAREFSQGHGELRLSTPLACELAAALKQARRDTRGTKLSKSDGDLRAKSDADLGDVRRSSWYSGPSEVSLDDIDLVMSKEATRIPRGQLSRCSAEGDLAPPGHRAEGDLAPPGHRAEGDLAPPGHSASAGAGAVRPRLHTNPVSLTSFDDSMSVRRSRLSIASGIYEEIPDLPAPDTYCAMSHAQHIVSPAVTVGMAVGVDAVDSVLELEEPTYESVSECVYATMRRTGKRYPPPPLPPRLPFGTTKLGESWNSRLNTSSSGQVTRHSSLGCLPRCHTTTLASKPRAFSVFRKRLKSDSRIASSPKSDTSKENKDVETKKKKFDFTPTRDIFKNFKVSRKMKNLKIALGKGETKSCEFLDETEHVTTNRCSKSVECLENNDQFLDEYDGDLSIDFNDDAMAALALPQEIMDMILRGREQINKIRLIEVQVEGDYMPMSPIIPPPPIEHHYIVMSPKTNLA